MRLTGFEENGAIFIGRIEGDMLVPLGPRESFWQDWRNAAPSGEPRLLSSCALRPAVPSTAKVLCIGLNYKAHAAEAGAPIPTVPVVFTRFADTLISDGDAAPAMDGNFDWEVELGVVIGATVFAASEAEVAEALFGYCTFNDLSCRTYQMETAQWALGKNTDRSGPMGPVVSIDEVGDPSDGWRLTTYVNDTLMQDGITSDQIFSVPQIVARVTRGMTLHPGDLIVTGTPSGVGLGRKPPVFLKPGDTVRVEVEGLGSVRTPIVGRPA